MTEVSDSIPMRELERLTGITRMTINFYIREGLLPKPQKTAPNMAYYNQDFVDRLKLIFKLRQQHQLSLAQIKHILENVGNELDLPLLINVRDRVFRHVIPDYDHSAVSWDELGEKTGLDEATLTRLDQMGLLYPEPGESQDDPHARKYHADTVVVAQLVKRFMELGVTLDEFQTVIGALDKVARLEAEIYQRHIQSKFTDGGPDYRRELDRISELAISFVSLAHFHNLIRGIVQLQDVV